MDENQSRNGDFSKWLNEVTVAERDQRPYVDRCKRVVERYRDEDRGPPDADLPARYNILWSNTETVGPALYSHTPNVQVDRRFKDSDPIGRSACQIWERATQAAIDGYDFDSLMKAVIKDYQLASRGTAWVRYVPDVQGEVISYQETLADHVHFSDFLHSPGKQWKSVRWVGRKIYLSRKQLIDRFGKDLGKQIPLDYTAMERDQTNYVKSGDDKKNEQARIYEIWDSESMKVRWLSKSYNQGLLDEIDDPLGLHGFYPTPKPLYGTTTTETLIPIPDYCLYQDQARELDNLTIKIALLEDALRLVGVYDASFEKLGLILQNTRQNDMIPIVNFPKFQAAGGFDGVMQFMPLEGIITALQALYVARSQVKSDLYEITGIADIIRGANSTPGTTATEQQIKGQFATLRIADRQRDVQRYARDLIALHGEIIAEHFEPNVIALMSATDVTQPDVQQMFSQAVALLKSDPIRGFRVSIESDSMVAIDEALDKQKGNEFLQAVGGFLEGGMKAMQMAPVIAPFISEGLLYITRRYNAGRSMEASIEQMGQGFMQMAQQAMSQPKQDPEVIKAQAQAQQSQAEAQTKMQMQQQEMQGKAQLSQFEMQQRMALEEKKAQQQLALDERKALQQLALDQKQADAQLQIDREKMLGQLALQSEKARHDMELEKTKVVHGHSIEHKKAVLAAGVDGLHVLKDGSLTTRPTMVKEGTFFNDPETGQRRVRIIEKPMDDE